MKMLKKHRRSSQQLFYSFKHHVDHEKEKALIRVFRRLSPEKQKEIEMVILKKVLKKKYK